MALASGVRWRDERIFAILEHADGKAVHETLGGSVEVAERGVAPPPPNDPDCVQVDVCREECHCPHRSEGASAEILRRETNGQAYGADHVSYGCHYLSALDRNPLVLVLHCHERSRAGGAMMSKVCKLVDAVLSPDTTCVAMAMANGISLDTVFLRDEEKADEVCPIAVRQACRG